MDRSFIAIRHRPVPKFLANRRNRDAQQQELRRALTEQHGKLRVAEGKWRGFVDKYRVEMLHDAGKVSCQVKSQMNCAKFQFQRQWRQPERAKIEALKEE